MISIEHHMKEDEIFILDDEGNHMDLNVVMTDDQDVFISQVQDDGSAQVIHISTEMFAQLFVAMQLPSGLYTSEAQQVTKQ